MSRGLKGHGLFNAVLFVGDVTLGGQVGVGMGGGVGEGGVIFSSMVTLSNF